ncbi:MAG: ABC transporter permease subunit [Pyrobaculum sp.]
MAVWPLVVKDLKEIVTSKYFVATLLGGLTVFIVMGNVLNMGVGDFATPHRFAIVVNGTTELGEIFVKNLQKYGGVVYDNFTTGLLHGYSYVVLVPQNFSFPATVEVIHRYRGVIPPTSSTIEKATRETAREVGIPPRLVIQKGWVYLNGVWLSMADVALLFGVFLNVWLFALIVPLMASSIASVSIGIEREKKMFELILSTPVSTKSIVLSKLISSSILALIQLAVFGGGMLYLLLNVTQFSYITPGQVSTTAGDLPRGLAMGPVVLFLSMASALSLVIISLSLSFLIATRAEDVRTAMNIAPAVVTFLALPAMAVLFSPLENVELYPFAHPIVVAMYALIGQVEKAYLYLALDWGAAAAALFTTFKIATPEYLLGRFK